MCPKEKLFKGYVQLERDLGEIDRCRKVYRCAICFFLHVLLFVCLCGVCSFLFNPALLSLVLLSYFADSSAPPKLPPLAFCLGSSEVRCLCMIS